MSITDCKKSHNISFPKIILKIVSIIITRSNPKIHKERFIMNNEINGISCHAKNCVYHKGTTTCTAGKIEVDCSSADRCSQTQCSTFKLNQNAVNKGCGCAD